MTRAACIWYCVLQLVAGFNLCVFFFFSPRLNCLKSWLVILERTAVTGQAVVTDEVIEWVYVEKWGFWWDVKMMVWPIFAFQARYAADMQTRFHARVLLMESTRCSICWRRGSAYRDLSRHSECKILIKLLKRLPCFLSMYRCFTQILLWMHQLQLWSEWD